VAPLSALLVIAARDVVDSPSIAKGSVGMQAQSAAIGTPSCRMAGNSINQLAAQYALDRSLERRIRDSLVLTSPVHVLTGLQPATAILKPQCCRQICALGVDLYVVVRRGTTSCRAVASGEPCSSTVIDHLDREGTCELWALVAYRIAVDTALRQLWVHF
jgi:hypothetical protein